MQSQFNIGSSIVGIFPSGADAAYTLFNNGPFTVYLGNDTGLSANTGFPIASGSGIVWDKGNPLYAICANGQYTTLYIIDNAGPSALSPVISVNAQSGGTTVQNNVTATTPANLTTTNVYGGRVFGNGSDGDVTIPSGTSVSLTRDMQYNSLTLTDSTSVLRSNGWRIRVSGTLTNNGGVIHNNGGDGGNGNAASNNTYGGGGGSGAAGGSSGNNGGRGGNGGGSSNGAGSAGVLGGNGANTGIGGTYGGNGGQASANGVTGALGNGGTAVGYAQRIINLDTTTFITQAFAPGGGGGGGSGASSSNSPQANGGAGGGGGGGGGVLMIMAYNLTNNGTISANGGKGGDAATFIANSVYYAAGGGGGGGGAGIVVLVYHSFSGNAPIALGGAGGAASMAQTANSWANPGIAASVGTELEVIV